MFVHPAHPDSPPLPQPTEDARRDLICDLCGTCDKHRLQFLPAEHPVYACDGASNSRHDGLDPKGVDSTKNREFSTSGGKAN